MEALAECVLDRCYPCVTISTSDKWHLELAPKDHRVIMARGSHMKFWKRVKFIFTDYQKKSQPLKFGAVSQDQNDLNQCVVLDKMLEV